MTADRFPSPPAHLSQRTKKLWRAIVSRFVLQPEHLEMLRLGMEAVDRTDQARRILAKDGLVVTGTRGAIQRHPMVDVEIQSRTAALRYFRELGLTEYVDDDSKQPRTPKGRFV
jgi:P27 family predicted phage terminase small subunit